MRLSTSGKAANIFGGGAAAVALLALWTSRVPPCANYSDHPVAVLAWAQANCKDAPELRSDAPRTHTDTILAVAGELDAARRNRPLAALCAEAMAIAAPVAAGEPQSEHPLARMLAALTPRRAAD
jgi:hypothetical protein